jgi:poly(3-hydroxybutyrate) depolymerase
MVVPVFAPHCAPAPALLLAVAASAALAAAPASAQSPDDSFAATYERLRGGPVHSREVPTGRLDLTRANADGQVHRYVLIVPDDYDPSLRYPVAFYLHGGVSRADPGPGGNWWRNYDVIDGHDRIAVVPLSWNESFWWQASQVENLRGILSDVKRAYNVDENRVYVFGTSDGGTGAYFLAFRDTTPWAAFLPFIGDPRVLLNPANGVDGDVHLANVSNKPLFIVNGETDPLYPVRQIIPFLGALENVGADFEFTPKPGGHNTSWWPEEEANIERFVADHPRDPHPDRVLWATERTDRYNRAHWVVIDEVGPIAGDAERAGLASITAGGQGGIIEATRTGNAVTLRARAVRRFTLLISPDEFDLGSPVRVVANGETVFDGMVRPDVEVLTKWAARDEDRTMLYAAEINVDLHGTR